MALRGVRVLEIAGLAPAPFCGMVLSDFGADVIRIDRAPHSTEPPFMSRGKRSIQINLKTKEGIKVLLRMLKQSDVLIEPFRPGVMERLGLGPMECLSQNKRLIYARLTGFGQDGPHARKAGHDINYLALSGILSQLGRSNEPPHFPVNLLADFAGGGLICAFGILAALYERERSGQGQVVDAAMTEGVAYLGSFLHKARKAGLFAEPRGNNMLDGGAPFYDTYETLDGSYMSVGSIEPQFYRALLVGLSFSEEEITRFEATQMDSSTWKETKMLFSGKFKTKSQKEWTEVFSKLDACVEPVLDCTQVMRHPHNAVRGIYLQQKQNDDNEKIEESTEQEPAPAPRLSRTPANPEKKVGDIGPGQHSKEILSSTFNFSSSEIEQLLSAGIVLDSSSISQPPLHRSSL